MSHSDTCLRASHTRFPLPGHRSLDLWMAASLFHVIPLDKIPNSRVKQLSAQSFLIMLTTTWTACILKSCITITFLKSKHSNILKSDGCNKRILEFYQSTTSYSVHTCVNYCIYSNTFQSYKITQRALHFRNGEIKGQKTNWSVSQS